MLEDRTSYPKLFISYSWSSNDHKAWVENLAVQLVEFGVDVILDVWALREGHDAQSFMEQMVTSTDIRKVLIVSDRIYSEKADGRIGGVGTETQIITPKVYGSVEQTKFVAAVTDRNSEGKPYLPTFMSNRKYIDFVNSSEFSESFDALVRWVFDRPLKVRPPLGTPPAHILEDATASRSASLHATSKAIRSIRERRENSNGDLADALSLIAKDAQVLPLTNGSDPDVFKRVQGAVEAFTPGRDSFIQIMGAISSGFDNQESRTRVHRFFEQLLPYLQFHGSGSYTNVDFDAARYTTYEFFLIAIAMYIRHDRFEGAANLFDQEYISRYSSDRGNSPLVPYICFEDSMASFSAFRPNDQARYVSPVGAFLKHRCAGTGLDFEELMQADLICWLRSKLHNVIWWFPHTLAYTAFEQTIMPVFARSKSVRYFDSVKQLLGINGKDELVGLITEMRKEDRLPRFDYRTIDIASLIRLNEIGTRP